MPSLKRKASDMKNVGMLELVDLPEITASTGQSETKTGYPLDTVTSLLFHDLRSPLSAIYGGAEMLLDGRLSPADSRRVASNMHRAAGRMGELIADVARILRRDAANNESRDLHTLLTGSCQAAGVVEHRGIDILLDIPPKTSIPVSPGRMK